MLTKTDVDGIVVLVYVARDVIQGSTANGNIDRGSEHDLQELHEYGPNRLRKSCGPAALGAPDETRKEPARHNPGSDVPMWRATPLILRLHDVLVDREELIAKRARQKQPNAAHEIEHVQGHEE